MIYVIKLMGNIKNKSILDLCASPGGKTAQMLNDGALVKAIDISNQRAKQLSNNIDHNYDNFLFNISYSFIIKYNDLLQIIT